VGPDADTDPYPAIAAVAGDGVSGEAMPDDGAADERAPAKGVRLDDATLVGRARDGDVAAF